MPAIVGDLLQQFQGLHGAGVSGLRSDPAPQLYRQGVGRAGTVHSEPSTAVGVNHKTAHLIGGQTNGISPNASERPDFVTLSAASRLAVGSRAMQVGGIP